MESTQEEDNSFGTPRYTMHPLGENHFFNEAKNYIATVDMLLQRVVCMRHNVLMNCLLQSINKQALEAEDQKPRITHQLCYFRFLMHGLNKRQSRKMNLQRLIIRRMQLMR